MNNNKKKNNIIIVCNVNTWLQLAIDVMKTYAQEETSYSIS